MTKAGCCLLALGVLLASGCDDPKPSATEDSASVFKPAPPPKPSVNTFTKMPDLVVDDMGAYFGGQRADVSKKEGKAKLTKIIEGLPINDEQVILRVLKKAKVSHVGEAVYQLGAAGAPSVLLKSDGRDDLPKELVIIPENKVSDPAKCSVAASVTKDLSTAVWSMKGGGGKKHRKGMAGPDLSNTAPSIEKAIARCDSDVAFFSGTDTLSWENTYNIGALLHQVDSKKDKKIKKLVLVGEEPVAGRAFVLRK